MTASVNLTPEYTYDIYVAAVNSVGEAASNTITVTVPPPVVSAASLSAAVGQSPLRSGKLRALDQRLTFRGIRGGGVTVNWKVGGGPQPPPFSVGPVTADQIGSFQAWFTGNVPEGSAPSL